MKAREAGRMAEALCTARLPASPCTVSASGCTALSTATMACLRVPSLYCRSTSCGVRGAGQPHVSNSHVHPSITLRLSSVTARCSHPNMRLYGPLPAAFQPPILSPSPSPGTAAHRRRRPLTSRVLASTRIMGTDSFSGLLSLPSFLPSSFLPFLALPAAWPPSAAAAAACLPSFLPPSFLAGSLVPPRPLGASAGRAGDGRATGGASESSRCLE